VDDVALHELHVDGVVGASYPSQLLEAGTQVGVVDDPPPELPPGELPPVPPPDEDGVVPPGHAVVGAHTLTWFPFAAVSRLQVVPEGHELSPSDPAHDEAQNVSP